MPRSIFVLFIIILLASCEQKAEVKFTDSPENLFLEEGAAEFDRDSFVKSYNDFGIKLLIGLSKEDSINPIISPYSICRSLSIAYVGSAGETEQNFSSFFKWQNNLGFHKTADDIDKILSMQQNDKYRLVSADKLFIGNGFSVYNDFVNNLKNFYSSEIEALNFKNKKSSELKINKWITSETDSLIQRIIEAGDIDEGTKMILVNACAFKGGWKTVFDKEQTHEGIFKGLLSEEKTEFMVKFWKKYDPDYHIYPEESYKSEEEKLYAPYLYNENAFMRVMRFPYAEGEANMYIFLPQSLDNNYWFDASLYKWEDIEEQLNLDSMLYLMDNVDSIHAKMTVLIPKFKSSYQVDMIKVLTKMGLKLPFSEEADFSRISDDDLMITKMKHKATIEVDETGTAAAAASLVEIGTKSLNWGNVDFIANVPFYYIIRDEKTGLILFIGKYSQVVK